MPYESRLDRLASREPSNAVAAALSGPGHARLQTLSTALNGAEPVQRLVTTAAQLRRATGTARPPAPQAPINDSPALEHEADVMSKLARQPSSKPPAAATGLRSVGQTLAPPRPVAQLQHLPARVTGLTHLVGAVGGSIFKGPEGPEVTARVPLTIETADRIRSRRGPNQETQRETDRDAEQLYVWVRVVAIGKDPVHAPLYVREDTLAEGLPLPMDINPDAQRDRLGKADGYYPGKLRMERGEGAISAVPMSALSTLIANNSPKPETLLAALNALREKVEAEPKLLSAIDDLQQSLGEIWKMPPDQRDITLRAFLNVYRTKASGDKSPPPGPA
jgi:hypothetical protein